MYVGTFVQEMRSDMNHKFTYFHVLLIVSGDKVN